MGAQIAVLWSLAIAVIRGFMNILLTFRVREVQQTAPSEVST